MDRLKPLEHKFKAAFFAAGRCFLKRRTDAFEVLSPDRVKRVLFLRPEKIGDMVISLPVFDCLKKHYPQVEISILGSPKNVDLIRSDPMFSRIYLYRKSPLKDVKEIIAMRRARYDAVVDMICDDSVTALFISQIVARGKPRIGVGKVKYREYYDFNYDHRLNNTGHIVDNTLKLLSAFGIETDTVDGYAPPFIDTKAKLKAERLVDEIRNDRPSAPIIGYNLSAGSPTRLWAKEKSLQLVRRILDHVPEGVVLLLTTPSERKLAAPILDQVNERVVLVPNGLSLIDVSAVISMVSLLISPDTSLVHIARSFRVPVVGLYSRFMKNFKLWRPYDQEVGAVVSANDHNIHDITVDQVFEAFLALLQQGRKVGSR